MERFNIHRKNSYASVARLGKLISSHADLLENDLKKFLDENLHNRRDAWDHLQGLTIMRLKEPFFSIINNICGTPQLKFTKVISATDSVDNDSVYLTPSDTYESLLDMGKQNPTEDQKSRSVIHIYCITEFFAALGHSCHSWTNGNDSNAAIKLLRCFTAIREFEHIPVWWTISLCRLMIWHKDEMQRFSAAFAGLASEHLERLPPGHNKVSPCSPLKANNAMRTFQTSGTLWKLSQLLHMTVASERMSLALKETMASLQTEACGKETHLACINILQVLGEFPHILSPKSYKIDLQDQESIESNLRNLRNDVSHLCMKEIDFITAIFADSRYIKIFKECFIAIQEHLNQVSGWCTQARTLIESKRNVNSSEIFDEGTGDNPLPMQNPHFVEGIKTLQELISERKKTLGNFIKELLNLMTESNSDMCIKLKEIKNKSKEDKDQELLKLPQFQDSLLHYNINNNKKGSVLKLCEEEKKAFAKILQSGDWKDNVMPAIKAAYLTKEKDDLPRLQSELKNMWPSAMHTRIMKLGVESAETLLRQAFVSFQQLEVICCNDRLDLRSVPNGGFLSLAVKSALAILADDLRLYLNQLKLDGPLIVSEDNGEFCKVLRNTLMHSTYIAEPLPMEPLKPESRCTTTAFYQNLGEQMADCTDHVVNILRQLDIGRNVEVPVGVQPMTGPSACSAPVCGRRPHWFTDTWLALFRCLPNWGAILERQSSCYSQSTLAKL